MTIEEEWMVIEYFKKSMGLGLFDLQKKDYPWPDFVFNQNEILIGIELTEAHHSEKNRESNAFKDKMIDTLYLRLKGYFNFDFTLDLELSSLKVTRREMAVSISELMQICSLEYRDLINGTGYRIYNLENYFDLPPAVRRMAKAQGYRKLPGIVQSIYIRRFDGYGGYNPKFRGGVVPNLNGKYLKGILERKETKNYQNCDSLWLVIWEGRDFDNYFNIIGDVDFLETRFDKVFVLRAMSSVPLVILK